MTDQFIGKVLADKYQIDSLISEDNLGNYYHATHLLMEKPVAVKILSPALAVDETIVKRFATEARTVSRISHPNILNVTDYGSDKNGNVFIVYEDAAGETLKDVIQRVGKFSLERANHILKQISSALSIAHANGIVHRNLMSDNILIRRTPTDAEEVKIFNFYIESENESDNSENLLTERAKYTSPEMVTKPLEVDERTDVYSLGVILYEMLVGEVPFTGEKPTEILLKHAEQMPPPVSTVRGDLPNEISEILMTALAKKPDLRYQTVNSLADSFNRATLFYQERANMSAASLKAAPVEAPSNNNLWKTAFIILAGACLMGAFFIYMTTGKQTNPSTQLQYDANGQPVQPLNPSTGSTEETYANMNTFDPSIYSNSNSNMAGMPTETDPYWSSGRTPPGAPPTTYGTPYQVYTEGGVNTVYMTGNGNSIFMQDDNTYVLVPKNSNPANNVNVQQSNTKTKTPANTANTATPANTGTKPVTSPTPPAANTAVPPTTKSTATPIPKPKVTATPQTKNTTAPSATDKRPPSGKEQDSDRF